MPRAKEKIVVCDRGCCTVSGGGRRRALGRGGVFTHALVGCMVTTTLSPTVMGICFRPYGHEGPHRATPVARGSSWTNATVLG